MDVQLMRSHLFIQKENTMTLEIGKTAPDFTLKSSDMEDVTLSSFQGKKNVVLLFIPLAFTGVCTKEFCSIRDGLNIYNDLNAEVLGISVDSPFTLKEWKQKENLNFTLLSDFNKSVSADYGAQYDDFIGLKGVAKRSAFVLDKEGKVQYAEVLESAGDLPNFDAVKAALKELG